MFVKICGTTNLEDALLSVELGADALGFIFAPSKRQVTVAQAAAITRELRPGVERVGVFVEPAVEQIAEAVRGAGLTAVQMHWRYDAGVVASLRRELGPQVQMWQVVGYAVEPTDAPAAEQEFARAVRGALTDPAVDAVLLDSVKGKASGGLGQVLPWKAAAVVLQREGEAVARSGAGARPQRPLRLLLAGGLTAENVGEARAVVQPDGVDVVSGVEAGPGKKSPDRLRMFFAAAKG